MTSIRTENLFVHRGRAAIVRGLSFASEEPGWIGLIGANGSGKTTLLRALAGRLPAGPGRILLDGADVTADRAARATRIGFAVEGSFLPDDLTPLELFSISAEAPRAWERTELQPLGEALRIDSLLNVKCGKLSAGMAQRAAIFGAFLDLPPIVILDEPFNWLDPVTAYDVKVALLALVQSEGLILITSLHDMTTLTSYCTRAILLSAGRIALALEAADLARGQGDPPAFEAMIVERLRQEP
jgi:ABC-type multidrug transport system ATPase subunit